MFMIGQLRFQCCVSTSKQSTDRVGFLPTAVLDTCCPGIPATLLTEILALQGC